MIFGADCEIGLSHEEKKFMCKNWILKKIRQKLCGNIVITSPTQCGKTEYVLSSVESMADYGSINILNCENYKAQKQQLQERMDRRSMYYYDIDNIKKPDIARINRSLSQKENVNLVMINNHHQIKKLANILKDIKVINRIVVFHDEGDTVNKSDSGISASAASQKLWTGILDRYSSLLLSVWVTATPDNIFIIQAIENADLKVLPYPENYRKVNEHYHWDGTDDSMIGLELNRIRQANKGEVILYCNERLKIDHLLTSIDFSKRFNCITVCFNGNGILAFQDGERINQTYYSIADCFDKIKVLGREKGVIVIGNNLIDRGLSFVGFGENPLAATVMFLKASKTSYCVSLCQRLGRITGCGRSDLASRRLYCETEVYNEYANYIFNQNLIYSRLHETGLAIDMLKTDMVKELKRHLDRPTLSACNSLYRGICKEHCCKLNAEGEIDGVKINHLHNWCNDKSTVVSKILHSLYVLNEPISIETLMNRIKYEKSLDSFESNICNSSTRGHLVIRKDRKIKLNPNIRKYLDDNKMM